MKINKNYQEELNMINETLDKAKELNLDTFSKQETVLVIVDMVNGFAKEGGLASPRIKEIINPIAELQKKCISAGIPIIAFADTHTPESIELKNYVEHCLDGTEESEIVDELKEIGGYKLIKKNSTNGFLEEEFAVWYRNNPQIKNWIVVGDCTDICILNFALTIKNDLNRRNVESRVIVPIEMVETYDLGNHNGDLLNIMSLFIMMTQGIEIIQGMI